MSKKCRIVNGGGSAVAADQPVAPKSRRVHPPSTNEINEFMEFNQNNTTSMIIQKFRDNAVKNKETISKLKKEVEFLEQKLAKYKHFVDEVHARYDNLDVLPFTPVSSTCSSSMGDLSSAEQHDQQEEQQDVKPKRRRKPLNKISGA